MEEYDEFGPKGESSGKVLGIVPFVFRPHLNSRFFYKVREDLLQVKVNESGYEVYALDDNSALKIVDGTIDVISEGEWLHLFPTSQVE